MRRIPTLMTVFAVTLVLLSCGDDAEVILNHGPCDSGLALDDPDAADGAKALDVCQELSSETEFGLISARYVRGSGANAVTSTQHGLQPDFGAAVTPKRGARMAALSTGSARTPAQSGYCGTSCSGYGLGTPPSGFPQATGDCPGSPTIFDDIGLELVLKAPAQAKGFTFDHIFFTLDNAFPCSLFNDQFVAVVDPAPAGSVNGNVAVDAFANPISINCEFGPGPASLLQGTGYENGFTTGWLRTIVPVTGGEEYTITFYIWDSGDDAVNSTILIDNFQWVSESVNLGTAEL